MSKESYIHLFLTPVFPKRALSGEGTVKMWARFLDLNTVEDETCISFCAKIRNSYVFDRPFKRIKDLKTAPSKHLYKVVQVQSLTKPGNLTEVRTREVQAIYDFCILKHHFVMEGILKEFPGLDKFEERFSSLELVEDALANPEIHWLPKPAPNQKRVKDSNRVYRDKNHLPGHFGG